MFLELLIARHMRVRRLAINRLLPVIRKAHTHQRESLDITDRRRRSASVGFLGRRDAAVVFFAVFDVVFGALGEEDTGGPACRC